MSQFAISQSEQILHHSPFLSLQDFSRYYEVQPHWKGELSILLT